MKPWKALMVVMLTVGCSVPILENTATAGQGAAKEAEGSHGSHADMACCHKERSHGSHADMACCHKKKAQGEAQAQNNNEKTCCDNHEGSPGADELEEGSH